VSVRRRRRGFGRSNRWREERVFCRASDSDPAKRGAGTWGEAAVAVVKSCRPCDERAGKAVRGLVGG